MRKCLFIIMIFLGASLLSCTKSQEKDSKIWLHRANDIAKAQYYQDKFSGLEVDVHFADGRFIIKHDADEKSQTTLDDWFSAIEKRSELGFWIDFKNLNYDNMEASVKEMAKLREYYNLKGMVIVESSKAGCLHAFDELGFRTSYYIPCDNPDKISKEKLQWLTNNIRSNIEKCNLQTISGYYYQYEFMKDSFPEIRKLIWYEQYDTAVRNKFIKLVNEDENTDVMLVAVKD